MYAVTTFLIVAAIGLLFTRLAGGALIATGLSPEVASFQARSAFTGAGFTTREAESVVNTAPRRRILSWTMMVGSLGIPTLVVTTLLGLIGPGPGSTDQRLLVTFVGIVVLLVVLNAPPVTRWLVEVGRRYGLRHLVPALETEIDELLDLGGGFAIAQIVVAEDSALRPGGLRAVDEVLASVDVLGLRRISDGRVDYLGEVSREIELHPSDALVLHGRRDRLTEVARVNLVQRPEDS